MGLPSRELTYPLQRHFSRWFSFPQGGICDRSLGGTLPETNSKSTWKKARTQKGNFLVFPTHPFLGAKMAVSFRGRLLVGKVETWKPQTIWSFIIFVDRWPPFPKSQLFSFPALCFLVVFLYHFWGVTVPGSKVDAKNHRQVIFAKKWRQPGPWLFLFC